jgi:hypothetical protein
MSLPTPIDQPVNTRQHLAAEIVRRQGLFASPQRKLLAAVVLSAIAHIVTGFFVHAEPPDEKVLPLVAKFEKLPPPPAPTAAVATPKPKPKPRPKIDKSAAVASLPSVEPLPVVDAAPVAPAEPVAPKEAEPEPVVAKEEPKLETPPAPVVAETKPELPPERLPPKKIELSYTAYLGEQKFEVGPVNLRFTHENGRYKLRVTGRGKGLAAMLYPGTFTGESEGMITAEGLRPDKFIEDRGSPDKRREANFNHLTKTVSIPDKEPLAYEGSPHDPLTWIVQFYFAMPKGEKTSFTVASTRRLDTYFLERTGDEKVEAPTGTADPVTGVRATREVATQVWKGSRKTDAEGKGGGSAQFWLAPEWHYVPFRLKIVNAQGRSASFELTGVNAE